MASAVRGWDMSGSSSGPGVGVVVVFLGRSIMASGGHGVIWSDLVFR